MATQTPMDEMLDRMGVDYWQKAKWLLWDLAPDNKTNLLHWLNRQPHPDIHYVSIVHSTNVNRFKMDMVVPEYSQDLRRIPVLQNKAKSYFIGSSPNGVGRLS